MPAVTHPPGRLTLPRVPLTNRAFAYTRSDATDVATTIERERQLLAEQIARQHAQHQDTQPLLPGMPQQPPKVTRLRAGLGQVIELPAL